MRARFWFRKEFLGRWSVDGAQINVDEAQINVDGAQLNNGIFPEKSR